jgi:hypothetical protein
MTRALSQRELLVQAASVHDVVALYGLRVWTAQEIDAHKRLELDRAPKKSLLWGWRHALTVVTTCLILAAVLVFCLSCLGMGVGILMLTCESAIELFWPVGAEQIQTTLNIIWSSALSFVIAVFVLGAVCMLTGTKLHGQAKWRVDSFEGYLNSVHIAFMPNTAQVIPAPVMPALAFDMLKAANVGFDVLKSVTQTKVRVHSLWQDEHRLDPILEIDGLFVLVWDKDGMIVQPPA